LVGQVGEVRGEDGGEQLDHRYVSLQAQVYQRGWRRVSGRMAWSAPGSREHMDFGLY
jgi:hypothetical protein